MKPTYYLSALLLLLTLSFTACTEDTLDEGASKARINAAKMEQLLSKEHLTRIEIYEYNPSTGGWNLAADTQHYWGSMDLCHVEDTYLYVNGGGDKSYPITKVPTHQLSGNYYFNLAYLVSFEMDLGSGSYNNTLHLYFKY
jgi:hypothetical protein